MALAAAGQADHPVLGRCVSFLARSVRDNGAWPIDTNLATWVTTLAIQALAAGENLDAAMPTDHRRRLADWLIRQQHTEVHPYTRAAPGGWAWTDLAGGVPDADDTAGALAALAHLAPDNPAERRGGSEPVPIAAEGYPPRREGERAAGAETRRAPSSVTTAAAGVRWLLGLQNADGGVPTFCRGWGRLPFDRSSPDLTAHALAAWSAWRDRLPPALREATDAAARRALAYLARTQRPDGAWVPLWFGNEHVADETNPTYGTARVVAALARVAQAGDWTDAAARPAAMAARGVGWLLSAQQPAGGWGGDENAPPSVEETALATEALARWSHTAEAADAARRGAAYLAEATRGGTAFEPAPIGFYFARLWYFERLYPVIFTVGALEAASGAVATR